MMNYDSLDVVRTETVEEMGISAAAFVAGIINGAIATHGTARVLFATGASQFCFLQELIKHPIDWNCVEAFHLDEYIGLAETHPASFRRYLRERLFDIVNPAQVHLLDGTAEDPGAECDRYTALLQPGEIHLACIGIGENGHIAFNDPPVADFDDPAMVTVVELDEPCRKQQLGEGWFPTMDDVPTHALTLTVPAIVRAQCISCFVPDERKAPAVRDTLLGPIGTACPASILRRHPNARLWIDEPAAGLLPH